MRFHFKTKYQQDIGLFQDPHDWVLYGLVAAVAICAPFFLGDYLLGEFTYVLILTIAGLGLMVLVGHTGQASLGHGAFLACGAYLQYNLIDAGLPFLVAFALAGLLSGIIGALVAIPALRMSGIYLAIATLAFGIITEDVIILLEHWTGGVEGVVIESISIFGADFDRYAQGLPLAAPGHNFYWLCLVAVIIVTWLYKNLLRSPTGRAFTAIRDSEVSARAMGINVSLYKAIAFGVSCCFTGLAGALLAHFLGAFNYEAFLIIISIQLLLMVTIGGLGSIHGAYFGALIVGMLPLVITIIRENISAAFGMGNASIPGLDQAVFACILIASIIIEPLGVYGRWLKIRTWFELFPLARKDMFKRHKSYLKTERMR